MLTMRSHMANCNVLECLAPIHPALGVQDVPRTFPNNDWVQSEAGQGALRHVLRAFAHHNPRVG